MKIYTFGLVCLVTVFMAACSTAPKKTSQYKPRPAKTIQLSAIQAQGVGREILMFTFGLLDNDYKFGGTNPEAGLDCSGMVGYIYKNAVGVDLPRTAAQIAAVARPINNSQLQVGDLVFFNTMNRAFSHMGIYIGDGKFVHAPRSNSTIRVERVDNPWFAARYEGARTLFASA